MSDSIFELVIFMISCIQSFEEVIPLLESSIKLLGILSLDQKAHLIHALTKVLPLTNLDIPVIKEWISQCITTTKAGISQSK